MTELVMKSHRITRSSLSGPAKIAGGEEQGNAHHQISQVFQRDKDSMRIVP
jgi:hypothetical protein